jgi:hypothetical protein
MARAQAEPSGRMSSIVVDTDVVSFLFKNHPTAALYDPEITGKIPIVSFMTIAELDRWALQSQSGQGGANGSVVTSLNLPSFRIPECSAPSGQK